MTDDLKGEMSKIEIIWIESEINSYLTRQTNMLAMELPG